MQSDFHALSHLILETDNVLSHFTDDTTVLVEFFSSLSYNLPQFIITHLFHWVFESNMQLQYMHLEYSNCHCFAKLSLAKCSAHSNKYLLAKGMNLRELRNLPVVTQLWETLL